MKKHNYLKVFAALLAVLLLVAGCNKEEDPPETPDGLSFDTEEVLAKLPDGLKNSNDPNAQACVDYVESAMDMSGFIDNMEVPDDAVWSSKKASGEGTWQWSWRYGAESVTFYWTYEETATKKIWTMDIQFNNGPRYSYIDAWESIDGTQGELIWNFQWAAAQSGEPVNEDDLIYWRYIWSLDNEGTYRISFYWDAEDDMYDSYTRYDVVVYDDGSGSVDYYMLGVLTYQMLWDVLGNGSWTYYIDGVVYLTGLWSAEGIHD